MKVRDFFLGTMLCTLAFAGCGEADKIENKITCSQVCNRYKDCFDSSYDTNACTDRCEAESNANEDKDRRLEQCDTCIDDRSCSSAAFKCTTECAGIIL